MNQVTGLPENVEAARHEIEQHIYQRTGNMPITDPNASIASYDLQITAAQSAVLNNHHVNRPNYGALAASTTQQPYRRSSALDNTFTTNGVGIKASFAEYRAQAPNYGVHNNSSINSYATTATNGGMLEILRGVGRVYGKMVGDGSYPTTEGSRLSVEKSVPHNNNDLFTQLEISAGSNIGQQHHHHQSSQLLCTASGDGHHLNGSVEPVYRMI